MGPLLYWILFSILVALLVIFVSYFLFNVIVDFCLVEPEVVTKYHEDEIEDCRLNKYQFDRHDVEDLTRIQGNLKTALPHLSLTNEVESSNVDKLLKKKDPKYSSLSNIEEEEGCKHSIDDLKSISSTESAHAEEKVQVDFKGKAKISQSVDNLEFCDPKAIDLLKEIHKIEDEAKKVERNLEFFIGSTSDVKYYEINETLLRLMISLCDLKCETDELRRKKSETLEYIESCQKKLKAKAADAL